MGPKRDWSAATEKLESEGRCRICGKNGPLERAHISGRSFDLPKTPGSKTLWVDPDDIVPLCGPFPEGCHGDFDHRRISILSHLTPQEQVKAVKNFQSLETARRRLDPLAFKKGPIGE